MSRRPSRRQGADSPYLTYLRLNNLDTPIPPGWSGRGNHVEYRRREDVPLSVGLNLGQGSYAVVQKVICSKSDSRPLAQKIIWNYKSRKGGIEQVMSEVTCIQHLRHRHIVQLVGTYVAENDLHILLFPVGQWNLRRFLQEFEDERMESKAYPDFYSLGTFFKCLASGLDYLHHEVVPRIEHFDIKPENIIVRRCPDRQLTVFITDFGVSRSFQPNSPSTDANTVYTSPIYQAPEIARKASPGRSADIFSLGCVFSEMATILARRTLNQYAEHRQHHRHGETQPSIAFESNLTSCVNWLEELKSLSPFERPRNGRGPFWWTGLLDRIEKMMSESPTDRFTSKELVESFPSGPCCKVMFEEYQTLQSSTQGDNLQAPPANNSPNAPGSPALTLGSSNPSDTSSEPSLPDSQLLQVPGTRVPTSQVIDLAPKLEPKLTLLSNPPSDDNPAPEFDWSGKGFHAQYEGRDEVPLEPRGFLGPNVQKVATPQGYVFAQKIVQVRNHVLRLEMLTREAKLLQAVRNPHIVRLVGTAYDRRFFSILTYPAADWNLSNFMDDIESERSSRDPITIERKQALFKFTTCLINALQYLHRNKIRHKDIKPSNILVQSWSPKGHGYHVYLSDFGISTQMREDDESVTTGPTSYTPRYAPPETLLFSKGRRGRSADIFSMGCVWVEMYTVIVGERLESLSEHLQPSTDSSPVDERDMSNVDFGYDSQLSSSPLGIQTERPSLDQQRLYGIGASYASSPEGITRWLQRLRSYCIMHASLIEDEADKFYGINASIEDFKTRFEYIESMLDTEPSRRPTAVQLCSLLGTNDCCTASLAPLDHEIRIKSATKQASAQNPPDETSAQQHAQSLSLAKSDMTASPAHSIHSIEASPLQSPKLTDHEQPPLNRSRLRSWVAAHLKRRPSSTSGSSSVEGQRMSRQASATSASKSAYTWV